MSGVHDSIWRSCQAAAERLEQQRAEAYNLHEPGPAIRADTIEVTLEDVLDDVIEITTALGVKRQVAERLVVIAWEEDPHSDAPSLAAWICRNQNRKV